MGSLVSRFAVPEQDEGQPHRGPVVSDVDVYIVTDSVSCLDAVTNVYYGHYRELPARFKEYRSLCRHAEEGIDVRATLMNEARLRRLHWTAKHVPIAGVYQANLALGSRSYLIEAPYRYVGLKEYLVARADIDRILLLKEALEIVEDLHSKGLVLGTIRLKTFVVCPLGRLLLSAFDSMCVEDPNSPFRPIPSPSLDSMGCMAPELLHSLKADGIACLTKATDTYAVGCFGYELLTDSTLFSGKYRGYPTHMAQFQLIDDVVDLGKRPEKPSIDVCARLGLTNKVWSVLEACWSTNPSSGPSVPEIRARFEFP